MNRKMLRHCIDAVLQFDMLQSAVLKGYIERILDSVDNNENRRLSREHTDHVVCGS